MERLRGAEDCLIIWLQEYVNKQPQTNPILDQIRSFLHCYNTDIKSLRQPIPFPEEKKKPKTNEAFILPQEEGISPSELFQQLFLKLNISRELPDVETFYSIVRSYSSNRAWVEISQLLIMLESMDINGTSTPPDLLPRGRGWYYSESLREYLGYSYPIFTTMVGMYEQHVKALCGSNLYHAASNVIEDMNALGYGFQPVILVHLFDVFSKNEFIVSDQFIDNFIAGFRDKIFQIIETAGKQLSHLSSEQKSRILTADEFETEVELDSNTKVFLQNMPIIVTAVNQAICRKGN